MISDDGIAFLFGVLVAAGVFALARWGLRRERYGCSQVCQFVCPRLGEVADCVLIQDVRTGQWKRLRSCSLLSEASEPCEWDCVKRLNLGLRLEGWRQTSAAPARPS